jgi:predicted permease
MNTSLSFRSRMAARVRRNREAMRTPRAKRRYVVGLVLACYAIQVVFAAIGGMGFPDFLWAFGQDGWISLITYSTVFVFVQWLVFWRRRQTPGETEPPDGPERRVT